MHEVVLGFIKPRPCSGSPPCHIRLENSAFQPLISPLVYPENTIWAGREKQARHNYGRTHFSWLPVIENKLQIGWWHGISNINNVSSDRVTIALMCWEKSLARTHADTHALTQCQCSKKIKKIKTEQHGPGEDENMRHREGEGLNCKTESLCGNTLRLELSNFTMYIYTVNVKVDFSILGKLCSIPYFGLRFICAKSKLATEYRLGRHARTACLTATLQNSAPPIRILCNKRLPSESERLIRQKSVFSLWARGKTIPICYL